VGRGRGERRETPLPIELSLSGLALGRNYFPFSPSLHPRLLESLSRERERERERERRVIE